MSASALETLGVISQLVGAVVAFIGLWKTWREFGHGERFLGPIAALVRATGQAIGIRVRRVVRRLSRRRPPAQVIEVPTIESQFGMGAVLVSRTYGPLPEQAEAAFAELHRRTLDLQEKRAAAARRLDAAVQAIRDEEAARASRLEAEVTRLKGLTHRVAVGGVRWEASGVFLVLLGLALQGIGMAIGSPS